MTTKTRRRKSPLNKGNAPKPIQFTDPLGRSCLFIPVRNGQDSTILEDHFKLMQRYSVTNPWRWHGSGKDKEKYGPQGMQYLKIQSKEPGKRGKNAKSRTRTASRLLVQCLCRQAGVPLTRDFEIAFNSHDRSNLLPENLKIRPRSENKHFVQATLAFTPGFNFDTGFDEPSQVSTES